MLPGIRDDGLMALFGYAVAHENNAERRMRAALAILTAEALADQSHWS